MDAGGAVSAALGLLLLGGLLLALARPAADGTLERNGAIGIRTRATRASDAAWRAGHRAAAPGLRRAGSYAVVLGALVLVAGAAAGVQGRTSVAAAVLAGAGYVATIVTVLRAARRADAAAREKG